MTPRPMIHFIAVSSGRMLIDVGIKQLKLKMLKIAVSVTFAPKHHIAYCSVPSISSSKNVISLNELHAT